MSRPKIWLTEDQILAAIDRTKRMADRKLKKSQELDEAAKVKFGKCEALRFELMKPMGEMERNSLQAKLNAFELSAGKAKEKADQAAQCYHRAINSTLPRLGEILSAFRTQPMAGIVGDYKGVSVR